MDQVLTSVAWMSPGSWREAHSTLAHLFSRYGAALNPVRRAAESAREGLERLFPYHAEFCRQVCPTCRSICCVEARVGFDFLDLLFLRALGFPPLPHQLRLDDQGPCLYLGAQGCTLPRIMRPFVCTWYYCAPMLELFYRLEPRTQRKLTADLAQAQKARQEMEALFIRVQLA